MPSDPKLFSTLVFIDLETTGLPSSTFQPEITECCMIAANRFSMEQSKFPLRVLNKLNICFYPTRTAQVVAERISGLNRTNLFHQKDFDDTAIRLIQLFLRRLDPPVCLIAHNGLRFDFPLLRSHLSAFQEVPEPLLDCNDEPIYGVDSKEMFRALSSQLVAAIDRPSNDSGLDGPNSDLEPNPKVPVAQSTPKNSSFSLGNVYSRVFGHKHFGAHTAEGDCMAMMQIVHYLGLSGMDWLQTNYVDFNVVRPTFQLPIVKSPAINDFPYARSTEQDDSVDSLSGTVSALSNLNLK